MKTIAQILIITLITMGIFFIVFTVTMAFTHNFWLTVAPASALSITGLIYFDNIIYKRNNEKSIH
jgi:hypothetical protein